MRRHAGTALAMVALLAMVVTSTLPLGGTGEDDGPEPADPFGTPEGPIPFPIINVSSSYDEDRFPTVLADEDALRVVWNKGAREMFVYHVVQREFDGEEWQEDEDWVSVIDPRDQDFVKHENYSHEGSAVRFGDLVYFLFSSDDQNFTEGGDHDIVLRSYDPGTGTWGPMVEVTPDEGGQDRDPKAVVMGDRMVIAWRTNDDAKADGTDDDIVLRTFDGAAFSAIVPVSTPDNEHPDAKLDLEVVGDRLCIVWEYNNHTNGPSDWDVLYREWDGQAFAGPPVQVSPEPGRVAKLPKIAAMGGDVIVVWESRPAAGQAGAVGIRGRLMVDGAPAGLVDVTRPGSNSENLQPEVISAGGSVYILWSTFDDSLAHGADSDIVMREYDGETLGDVLEVSHPRDGPDVNEGFVTACVFQDNIYAVWRMMYDVDPSVPLDVPVNEDIVIRRVTDFRADIEVATDGTPKAGDVVNLTVTISTFHGLPAPVDDLDVRVVVRRDQVVLPVDLQLTKVQPGSVLEGSFVVDTPGEYVFTAVLDEREKGEAKIAVYGAGSDGDGDGGPSFFVYYTIAALALLAVALVLFLRGRR